jgi:hypothetical protein
MAPLLKQAQINSLYYKLNQNLLYLIDSILALSTTQPPQIFSKQGTSTPILGEMSKNFHETAAEFFF